MHRLYKKDQEELGPPVMLQHGLVSIQIQFGDLLVQLDTRKSPLDCSSIISREGRIRCLAWKQSRQHLFDPNFGPNFFWTQHCQLDRDLDESEPEFYNFCFYDILNFYELGKYDVPAMIDYVLICTNNEKFERNSRKFWEK